MAEETVFVPTEPTTESADEPLQRDDLRPRVTTNLPLGLEPLLSESAAHPQEATIASSDLESEPLAPEPLVRPIHVGVAQLEVLLMGDLSLGPDIPAPGPHSIDPNQC